MANWLRRLWRGIRGSGQSRQTTDSGSDASAVEMAEAAMAVGAVAVAVIKV